MDARRTTDNSVFKSHASCTQEKAPYYPEITGWTHQPSIPSLKAAALSKSGCCLGHGQLGCGIAAVPMHLLWSSTQIPAQINSPVTLSFVNKLLSTCSEI